MVVGTHTQLPGGIAGMLRDVVGVWEVSVVVKYSVGLMVGAEDERELLLLLVR